MSGERHPGSVAGSIRGRGTAENPANRFEPMHVEFDEPSSAKVRTRYYEDATRSILARNDSPDIPFDIGINPYRGCEHGCVYCYARPSHEFLGFSAGLDFESRIMVKKNAPELLRAALADPGYQARMIALSGNTDCYQPIESKLRITRSCLEVLAEFRNPVGIITKNRLVIRDIDVLGELAGFNAASVTFSVTTLDNELRRKLEPRASNPRARIEAIRSLNEAGIPTGVMIAPTIPGLTDHEIPAILEAAADAGARWAGYQVMRLPGPVLPLFVGWLEEHYPDRKERVLARLRDLRQGELTDGRFGLRMRGSGVMAEQIRRVFQVHRRRVGIPEDSESLSTEHFRRSAGVQLSLF